MEYRMNVLRHFSILSFFLFAFNYNLNASLLEIVEDGVKSSVSEKKLEYSCERQDGESCRKLGILFKEDKSKMKRYFSRACRFNDSRGCLYRAEMYMYGDGTLQDKVKAKKFYKKSCDLDNSEACFRLGVIVSSSGIENENPEVTLQALKLFEKSCKMDNVKACKYVGLSLMLYEDVNAGYDVIAASCIKDEAQACFLQAVFTPIVNQVPQDTQVAELMIKSCKLGSKFACEYLRKSLND